LAQCYSAAHWGPSSTSPAPPRRVATAASGARSAALVPPRRWSSSEEGIRSRSRPPAHSSPSPSRALSLFPSGRTRPPPSSVVAAANEHRPPRQLVHRHRHRPLLRPRQLREDGEPCSARIEPFPIFGRRSFAGDCRRSAAPKFSPGLRVPSR
jgi:hypothetical protein